MIDKTLLMQTVEQAIAGSDLFLVDITISRDNRVEVEIDSDKGVDIDACVDLTRKIEAAFDRDVEDYELEVGSAGLTSPFKVVRQYQKNVGNRIEVLTRDGRKLKGLLSAVTPEESTFVLTVSQKVKEPGQKKPVIVDEPMTIAIADCKTVRYLIEFK